MRPFIALADVTIHGGLDADGETYGKCRLTMVGKPTTAILYSREIRGPQWRVVDRLTGATVTEHDDGRVTIEGTSDELITVVGVRPSDAQVRWEVRPRGCRGCQ